jgi:hypothetical protein
MLFWWNRGIQLNSNGLPNLAASAILSGRLPYRDFHYWCPPGHLLIWAAITACFGDGLIYVRAFAVLERMAIFVIVYFWLTQIFSPRAAFFGTFTAAMGFSSDIGDVIAHYGFDSVLASVLAGFSASIATASQCRYARIFYFLTGVFAGLCMLAKQTQGVGMFGLLLVIFLLATRSRGLGFSLRVVSEYLAGWAVPTGLVAFWLFRGGAWKAFIQQAFVQGSASKGSLREILLRPLLTLAFDWLLLLAFIGAALLLCLYALLSLRQNRSNTVPGNGVSGKPWSLWFACLLALALAFGTAWYSPKLDTFGPVELFLILISATCIFIGFYGSAAIAIRYTFLAIRQPLDRASLCKWILASVSALTAYMFSLSWAAFEQMLVPSFAFVIALALDRQLKIGNRAVSFAIVALGLVLASTAAFRKLEWPYTWENWVDGPIKEETVKSDFPELAGLRVTPESAAFIARVTKVIDAHSLPDQTILCFPNYALFYVLSHRTPATFAFMHWFDIVPDALAREEAKRIQAHPPAVILFVDIPEEIIQVKEISYRGGRRSGQRDMIAAIQSLPGYRIIETVPIPHIGYPLKIYARE